MGLGLLKRFVDDPLKEDAIRRGLISAGLTMMASQKPTFLGVLGEGGAKGYASYADYLSRMKALQKAYDVTPATYSVTPQQVYPIYQHKLGGLSWFGDKSDAERVADENRVINEMQKEIDKQKLEEAQPTQTFPFKPQPSINVDQLGSTFSNVRLLGSNEGDLLNNQHTFESGIVPRIGEDDEYWIDPLTAHNPTVDYTGGAPVVTGTTNIMSDYSVDAKPYKFDYTKKIPQYSINAQVFRKATPEEKYENTQRALLASQLGLLGGRGNAVTPVQSPAMSLALGGAGAAVPQEQLYPLAVSETVPAPVPIIGNDEKALDMMARQKLEADSERQIADMEKMRRVLSPHKYEVPVAQEYTPPAPIIPAYQASVAAAPEMPTNVSTVHVGNEIVPERKVLVTPETKKFSYDRYMQAILEDPTHPLQEVAHKWFLEKARKDTDDALYQGVPFVDKDGNVYLFNKRKGLEKQEGIVGVPKRNLSEDISMQARTLAKLVFNQGPDPDTWPDDVKEQVAMMVMAKGVKDGERVEDIVSYIRDFYAKRTGQQQQTVPAYQGTGKPTGTGQLDFEALSNETRNAQRERDRNALQIMKEEIEIAKRNNDPNLPLLQKNYDMAKARFDANVGITEPMPTGRTRQQKAGPVSPYKDIPAGPHTIYQAPSQKTAMNLENALQKFGDDLGKTNISELDQSLKDAEDVLSKHIGKDIPGYGTWTNFLSTPMLGVLSDIGLADKEGVDLRQSISQFKNIKVRTSAGLSQTAMELNNVLEEIGTKAGQSDYNLIQGMITARKLLEKVKQEQRGLVHPDVYSEFVNRSGGYDVLGERHSPLESAQKKSQYPTPSNAAINALRANRADPEAIRVFEKYYGPGSASRYLGK